MISIILDDAKVVAGDRISGHVTYVTTEQTLPKTAKVELVWRTEGRGTKEHEIVRSLTLSPTEFSTGSAIPFAFQTPYEGPITYNGSLLRIIWEIKTTVTLPGLRVKKDELAYPFSVICR